MAGRSMQLSSTGGRNPGSLVRPVANRREVAPITYGSSRAGA